MDGLVLSLELIQFLHWFVTNRKDLLESAVAAALEDKAFAYGSTQILQMDGPELQQTILNILKALEDTMAKLSPNTKLCTKELVEDKSTGNNSKRDKLRLEMLKKASLELASNMLSAKA